MDMYSFRDSNIRKTWFLFFVFLLVVIGAGWAFSYIYQDQAILYIAVGFSVFMSFSAYFQSDKVALALSKAHKISRKSHKELFNIVENLCISQGLPVPNIYVINDSSPNAFATGRNPKNSSIAVTTGLLDILDRSELEGVVAHELSHIKNYDILVSSVVIVLVGFLSIISDIFLRSMFFRGRDDRNGGNGFMMLIGIVLAVVTPIVGTLIQLAISRKREYLADASGALATRYPEGLASALEKISKAPPMKPVSSSIAHLYIAEPLKLDTGRKVKGQFFAKFFMTHPPIKDRIEKLRGNN